MPDLGDIIRGVGAFFEGASNGAIINNWLEMPQREALNSIEEFIKNASSEQIDSMDASLLQIAHMHLSPENRMQLIKFYAFYKLVEYHRFQKWRGFPRTMFD